MRKSTRGEVLDGIGWFSCFDKCRKVSVPFLWIVMSLDLPVFLFLCLCYFFYVISSYMHTYMFSALMKTREEIKQFHLCTLPCINTSVMFVMIFSLTLNVIERIPSSLQLFDVECDLWEVYRVLHLTLSSEMPFFAMAICHV